MFEKGKRLPEAFSQRRTEIFTLVFFTLVGALIILGIEMSALSLAAFAISAVYLVACRFDYAYYFALFLVPFANVFKMSAQGTSMFTYLTLLLAVRALWQNRKGYNVRFVICLLLFAVYVVVGGRMQFTTIIKQLAIPILIYGYFQEERGDSKKLCIAFAWGMILSSIFATFRESFPHMTEYIILTRAYELDHLVYRTSGLYSDPNYYSAALIMASCGLLSLYISKRAGAWILIPVVVLTIFGAGTVSKSFILMLMVESALFVLLLFVRKRYWAGLLMLFAVMVLGIAILSGKIKMFQNVIERLTGSMGNAQEWTTGRTIGWGNYLKAVFEKEWWRGFVGYGIAAGYVTGQYAAHNTYLDFLYHYGILGSGLFVATCTTACVPTEKKKKNLLNYYSWFVLAMMIFFLSYLTFYDFVFLLILAISGFREDFSQIEGVALAES